MRCAVVAGAVLQAATGEVAAEPPTSRAAVAPTQVASTFDLRIVASDGKAIPRVQVDFLSEPAIHAAEVRRGKFVSESSYGETLESDGEGRIVLVRPAQWNRLDLFIEAPGYARYCASWRPQVRSEPIPAEYIAKLEPGWSVGGTIVDDQGKPIAGARILPPVDLPFDQEATKRCLDKRPRSDAAGKWHFDCVPIWRDPVTVEVDHPNFMPKSVTFNRADFDVRRGQTPSAKIVLDPGLTVVGKVTDAEGEAVAGALVQANLQLCKRKVLTDAEGNYRLVGCKPLGTTVLAAAKGLAPAWRPVWIQSGMKPVDFQMKRGGTVRLRLLDEHGKPIPKARLLLWPFADYELERPSEYTDSQGAWAWSQAPADQFSAWINLPDGRGLNSQPLVAGPRAILFRAPPAVTFSGRVIDARTKQPIKKFRVVPGASSWIWNENFLASGGSYWFRAKNQTAVNQIRLEADGHLPSESGRIKQDVGDVTVDFTLTPAEDTAGIVLTADGRPAAYAKVAMGHVGSHITIPNGELPDHPFGAQQRLTDDAGRFRFPREKAKYWLVITHRGGYAKVECSPDSNPKPIRLTAWSRLEGTYYVAGKPQPYISLSVMRHSNDLGGKNAPSIFSSFSQTTDSRGRYEFDRLMPGAGTIGRPLLLMEEVLELGMASYGQQPLQFQPGQTVHFDLGASGRPVIGQLRRAPDSKEKGPWSRAVILVHADNPQLRESSPSFDATLAPDGNFCIDGVPAGKYVLTVRVAWIAAPQLEHHFNVPAIDKKLWQRPVDLGVLTLKAEKMR
jgi:hypothetical protein